MANIEKMNEDLLAKKAEIQIARDEFYAFLKENGLKRNQDYSEDAKVGKKFSKHKAKIAGLVTERDNLVTAISDAKPKKEKSLQFEAKYTYPVDVQTAAQKKKYRLDARRDAKKAERANEAGEDKEIKKAKPAAKVTEEVATPKKKKKPTAAETDED